MKHENEHIKTTLDHLMISDFSFENARLFQECFTGFVQDQLKSLDDATERSLSGSPPSEAILGGASSLFNIPQACRPSQEPGEES